MPARTAACRPDTEIERRRGEPRPTRKEVTSQGKRERRAEKRPPNSQLDIHRKGDDKRPNGLGFAQRRELNSSLIMEGGAFVTCMRMQITGMPDAALRIWL